MSGVFLLRDCPKWGKNRWFAEHRTVGEPLGERSREPSLLCHRPGVELITASGSSQLCLLPSSVISWFNIMRRGVYANMAFLEKA